MTTPTSWKHFAALAALALLAPPLAHALSSDSEQAIEIEADFAELDEKEGKTFYSGNVVVTQGSIRMTGDRLRVHLDDDNVLEEAFLEGRPASFQQRPDDAENDIVGRALTIEYHAMKDLLYLIENAHVTRGEESFEGYRIDYDTERSIITARSAEASGVEAAPGSEQPAGRVRIVLPPRKKAEQ